MIIKIEDSPVKNKRFRITMDNSETYDFGYFNGSTYIDHKDEKKRNAYLKRHYANPIEKKLIDNLVPSPSLYAAYILWGPYDNIEDNIENLNNLWIKKENKESK
jgi:hypothetical protein